MSSYITVPAIGGYQTTQEPRIIPLVTTANYEAITTAGFLNTLTEEPLLSTDTVMAVYGNSLVGQFNVSISSSGIATMTPLSSAGEVSLIGTAVEGNLTQFADDDGDIEDSGIVASTVLTTSSTATDYQMFVPLQPCVPLLATWTLTRVIAGVMGWVKTPAEDSAILTFDITPYLRTTALQGFSLTSISCAYSIGVTNLVSHNVDLTYTTFVSGVNPAVTEIALASGGALGTVAQGTPLVTPLAVTTPVFLTAANTKMTADINISSAVGSTYTFYGMNLFFTKTVV